MPHHSSRHKSHYLYYPSLLLPDVCCPRFCCTINHCTKGKNRDTPRKRRGVNPFFVNSGEARKGGGRVNGYVICFAPHPNFWHWKYSRQISPIGGRKKIRENLEVFCRFLKMLMRCRKLWSFGGCYWSRSFRRTFTPSCRCCCCSGT